MLLDGGVCAFARGKSCRCGLLLGGGVETLTILLLAPFPSQRPQYCYNDTKTSSSSINTKQRFNTKHQGVADMDVPSFCRRFVEPMAEESDHLQAQALCDALQLPITIVYLDSRERGGGNGGGGGGDGSGSGSGSGEAGCEVHAFEPSPEGAGAIAAAAAGEPGGGGGGEAAAGGRGRPRVHLLYRPGHYDIACE